MGALAVTAVGLTAVVGCTSDDGGARDADVNPSTTVAGAKAASPKAPLSVEGTWLTDERGRVVQIRGVNEVFKEAPYYPAADGFGADDAAFLAENGFNTVRLGVDLRGLMPEPGEISEPYLDALAGTVGELAEEQVMVLLDFHQDGYAPKYNGNGFPDWMAIDDGEENPPDAVFPLYYVQNPAMQRAWENFWADRKGPDGVGVQTRFLEAVSATAEHFAGSPNVIGYEAINEPFPGSDYGSCLTAEGCPEIETERIGRFGERMEAAVREHTEDQLVWVEPFGTHNFGNSPTALVGSAGDRLLAVHSYATTIDGEAGVVDHAVDARARDGKPVLLTEFGATNDPKTLDRLIAGFDGAIIPWMFWAYNENIVGDEDVPIDMDNVADPAVVRALVRPYPRAVAGTPGEFSFDPASRRFALTYDTKAPSGRQLDAETEVFVPELQYPNGYAVSADGATVTSEPCATTLTLQADPDASSVTVRITPAAAGSSCPS